MNARRVLAAVGAVSIGLIWASSALAAGITIGQFNEEAPGNANLFSYTESGVSGLGGTASLSAVSIPVSFRFESIAGLPADLQGGQDAMLTLQAITIQPVINLLGITDGEAFTPPDGTGYLLTITRDAPAAEGNGSQTNLLSVLFNSGELFGTPGANIASFANSSPTYFSDFLNFTNGTPQDLNLAFSSWTTTADGGGVELDPSSNFFQNATAAGVGTFDVSVGSTTMFPEPNPAALSLLALAAIPMFRRRRHAAR